jgi:hypothetical protein
VVDGAPGSRVGAARLRKGLLSYRGAGVLLVRRSGVGSADGAGPAAAPGLVPAAVAVAAAGAAVVILDASDAMAAMVADCRFGGPGRVAEARRMMAPGALLQSIVQVSLPPSLPSLPLSLSLSPPASLPLSLSLPHSHSPSLSPSLHLSLSLSLSLSISHHLLAYGINLLFGHVHLSVYQPAACPTSLSLLCRLESDGKIEMGCDGEGLGERAIERVVSEHM